MRTSFVEMPFPYVLPQRFCPRELPRSSPRGQIADGAIQRSRRYTPCCGLNLVIPPMFFNQNPPSAMSPKASARPRFSARMYAAVLRAASPLLENAVEIRSGQVGSSSQHGPGTTSAGFWNVSGPPSPYRVCIPGSKIQGRPSVEKEAFRLRFGQQEKVRLRRAERKRTAPAFQTVPLKRGSCFPFRKAGFTLETGLLPPGTSNGRHCGGSPYPVHPRGICQIRSSFARKEIFRGVSISSNCTT